MKRKEAKYGLVLLIITFSAGMIQAWRYERIQFLFGLNTKNEIHRYVSSKTSKVETVKRDLIFIGDYQ